MPNAICPECDHDIPLTTPKEGMKVVCPRCEAELEVVSLHPLELDWVYEEDEEDLDEDDDWGLDDEDEDDWDMDDDEDMGDDDEDI